MSLNGSLASSYSERMRDFCWMAIVSGQQAFRFFSHFTVMYPLRLRIVSATRLNWSLFVQEISVRMAPIFGPTCNFIVSYWFVLG